MNDNIRQEILNRLDALAQKLGTTGQFIWSTLIRQARIQGIIDALISIAAWATFFLCVYFMVRFIKHRLESGHAYWEDTEVAWFWASLGLGVPSLITASVFTCDAVIELLNPAYWALERILEGIRP